ncbi:MAG: phage tail protein [Magnetococcales bacterium]|nr:phage tail protein [Magnetococcales bacterium]
MAGTSRSFAGCPMRATVKVNSHPLLNRSEKRTIRRRVKVAAMVPRTSHPVIAIYNGKPLMRVGWNRRLADGDILEFYMLPLGGGGKGGSNPIGLVLGLATMFILPGIGGMIGAELGLSTAAIGGVAEWSSMSLFKGAFALSVGGLLSSLLPTPKQQQSQVAASIAAPSPTYSISAQGNTARIDSPIPVQYGRMKFFPEFAAVPYTEYSGNDQYLYELLCLGCGKFDVESINIQDTPISSFAEVSTEIIQPGGVITLFPANVITSVEVSGQAAQTSTALGPFTANSAGTEANALAIDVAFPRGVYYANDGGGLDNLSISWTVEARTVDDVGSPTGGYFTLGSETFTGATTTPQRRSYRYSVTAGRYQVLLTRTDTKHDGDSRYGHEINWVGLRAYLPETRDFGNVTLLAVRLRATDNLSGQAARQINVIATRKIPTWDPDTGWSSPVATRSIAWAIADAARNSDYGGRMTDSRIDLQALHDLDTVWTTRGDHFDGRFDGQTTVMDALGKIALAGRAKVYQQGGMLRVFRDASVAVPSAMFTERNMVKGSFSIEYVIQTEESANYCDVGYWDGTVWAPRRVDAKLPGVTASTVAKLETFGVTGRDQACREGAYFTACSLYRRRLVHFSTEMAGYLPTLGDLIVVQHSMPTWGQHGEIVAWDADNLIATLSDPPEWTEGEIHYIGLRTRTGGVSGPWEVTAVDGHPTQIQFAADPGIVPYTDLDAIRTHVTFGPGENWRQLVRVTGIKPQSQYVVAIDAVNEDARVHAADTGITVPPPAESLLSTVLVAPVVTGLQVRTAPSDPNKILITWQAAPGAEYYVVEESADGMNWQRIAEPRGTSLVCEALYGVDTLVRVAAVGAGLGEWAVESYSDFSPFMWTTDDALMWTTDDALMWRT